MLKHHKYNKRYIRSVAVNKAASKMPDLLAQRPILVTGSHRSGTTIVGTLLAASSQVRYIYEPLNPKDGVYMNKQDFGICKVCNVRLETYFLKIDSTNEAKYIPHFRHLLNAKVLSGKRPLLKSPFTIFAAEWLADRYGSKNIVLLRDPRAFVSSLKKMDWDEEIDGLVNQPKLLDAELKDFKQQILKYHNRKTYSVIERGAIMWAALYGYTYELQKLHPDWMFVKLEDFQANPVEVMGSMYDYTGLEFNDVARQMTKEMTGSRNSAESSPEVVHSIKRNAKAAALTWQKRLDSKEIQIIEAITSDVANKIGY